MKKLIVAAIVCLMASTAFAADVPITITIPDAAVARVTAMVNADLNCGELGPAACLKAELVRHVKYLVLTYEKGEIIKTSQGNMDDLTDPVVDYSDAANGLVAAKLSNFTTTGYAGLPGTDTTITEDYGDLTSYPSFKRVSELVVTEGTKTITVTVYWDADNSNVSDVLVLTAPVE